MVNKGYLNRANGRSRHREKSGGHPPSPPDGLHPRRIEVDQEGGTRERNTIGDVAALLVQPLSPELAGEQSRQRDLSDLDQQEGQRTAEHRGINEIVHKVVESEPYGGGRGELGVAAAHPAARKEAERDDEHYGCGAR